MPIDVLIVEDNDVFREALEVLLGLDERLRVIASVPDGHAALAAVAEQAPDVVVLDYRLPDLDGVETARALREACPGTAVVALTATAEEPVEAALRRAGAVSCLTKDRALPEIVAAITEAADRGGPAR